MIDIQEASECITEQELPHLGASDRRLRLMGANTAGRLTHRIDIQVCTSVTYLGIQKARTCLYPYGLQQLVSSVSPTPYLLARVLTKGPTLLLFSKLMTCGSSWRPCVS